MQLLKSTPKKLYQFILSTKQPSQLLHQSLTQLLKKTIESSQHFDFLLHRINWFQPPFTNYQPLFIKILRIYRSASKQSSKVIYNLLIEAFTNSSSAQQARNCLVELFQDSYHKRDIIQCLKENYPHKLCALEAHELYMNNLIALCKQFQDYRMDFLEIIIENLVNFDTELVLADEWVHKPFPEDAKIQIIKEKGQHSELSQKFDILLFNLLTYLNTLQDDKIITEILLLFNKKVLPIKTTKLIQLIIFSIAQTSSTRAKTFVCFLLSNIFDSKSKENFYRIFTQSNFYLFSYILRSKILSKKSITQYTLVMIERLKAKLCEMDSECIDVRTNLKQFYLKNQLLLMILQTIIVIKMNHQSHDSILNEEYNEIIEISSKKLHFEYFIRQEILRRMNIDRKDNKKNVTVKFSNKFLPATLPNVASLIDPKMKLNIQEEKAHWLKDLKHLQPLSRKLHKGQTPISYGSQTLFE